MSVTSALVISLGIVGLSAFFVAIEFALVAARRYRLEEAEATSAAARAAVKSTRELSLLLAGSQLGITLCTLALGAIAKPTVHNLLTPLLHGWGLPLGTADVLAFVLALAVVTFVHLVVGEMAPKSWAIAHPERSATLLALPMRGFLWLTRPALVVLNNMANWCLRKVGVEPVDEMATGRTPEDLRQLVDHSAEAGALDPGRQGHLATALELHTQTLREVARPIAEVVGVPADADVERVQATARDSGHLRLVVWDGTDAVGVVHVRDTLARPASTPVTEVIRPALFLTAETPVYSALSAMREKRGHFALVRDDGRVTGLVTMQDLLERVLPGAGRPR
ncbi:hemolysin family protein [Amycolatopsis plumensis]|uniref:Hemolysin family protein n=1 Tax=Amycolatopsis plumensis TaxID=236508 RepID=A0ABV5UHW6_9PSEU